MTINSPDHAIGLDISDLSIKLVEIHNKFVLAKKPKFIISNFGSVPLPQGLITNGKILEKKKLSAIISKFIKTGLRRRLDTRLVVANLPDDEIFLTTLEIPVTPDNGTEELFLRALEKNIPLPVAEIYYDRIALGLSEDKKHLRFLVGAVKTTISDSYADMLEEAGLSPMAMEPEPLALVRALLPFGGEVTNQLLIIDFGATRSNLIIANRSVAEFAITLPMSGNAITATIAEKLGTNIVEAEKLKMNCGFDLNRCDIELRSVLGEQIDNVVAKIKDGIKFYESQVGQPLKFGSPILLAGGGAALAKIDTVLSEKLKIKVRLGDPLINIDNKAVHDLNKPTSFATAIGLALLPKLNINNNNAVLKSAI